MCLDRLARLVRRPPDEAGAWAGAWAGRLRGVTGALDGPLISTGLGSTGLGFNRSAFNCSVDTSLSLCVLQEIELINFT